VPRTVGEGQGQYTILTSAGDYLYAVSGYRVIQMVKSSGESVASAGQSGGQAGYLDGTGTEAWFGQVRGLASDGSRLYATDNTNKRIRALAGTS